jgi:hypothetical protein
LTGELGIRNVLFDEVAELGVRTEFEADARLAFVDGPKIETWDPAGTGVDGWAMLVMVDQEHIIP